jgi:surfeit locus 1 family protein
VIIVPSIRVGSRVFAPRLVPTLVMLPLLALLVGLGTWQLERAAEKRALLVAFARGAAAPAALPPAAAAARYTRVAVGGHYLSDRQFLLDNMTHDGRVGYRVLTPLERADGTLVLVDRGWLPGGPSRAQLPEVAVGDAPREVSGRLDELPRAGVRLVAPAEGGWPRRVSFPTHAELEAALGRPLYPRLLLLDAAVADGYLRDWRPPGMPPERHVGYAVQWYALALTLVVIWVIVNLKRRETLP